MLQIIEGVLVYVVEFDTMPKLPIIGLTEEEVAMQGTLADLMYGHSMTYAEILTEAIQGGLIEGPGKYGIHINHQTGRWEVARIIER